MEIEGVDPRDIEWELDCPVYRVYFWSQPAGGAAPAMYHAEEHRITGARDVHDVIAWATDKSRPDQVFTLYVEHTAHGSRGLIRLGGEGPACGH